MSTEKQSFDGYVADIPYVAGVYRELSPTFLNTIKLLHKQDISQKKGEPLRYLELGYGQGFSLAVHAASHEGEFWGTDFIPEHTITAQKMINAAGVNANILNDSFEELAQKAKNGLLPSFDFITLHGIWSWINDENRDHILSIISCSLKVGGIVYVSYNALPGFASFQPVRDFFTYCSKKNFASNLPSVSKLSKAYATLKVMRENGSQYFFWHPSVVQLFDQLDTKDPAYLVHEYMNEDWKSFYFREVSEALAKAKCRFVGSARSLTALTFTLAEDVRKLLGEAPDVETRETLRDYANNTQFRSDIFTKGNLRLDNQSFLEKMKEVFFVMLVPKEKFAYTVKGLSGDMECSKKFYEPLVEFLALEDYRPKAFSEICNVDPYQQIEILIEVITVLIAGEVINPAQVVSEKIENQVLSLNMYFCGKNDGNSCQYLASPVTGTGYPLSSMEQTMLLAKAQGHEAPSAYISHIVDIYKQQEKDFFVKGERVSYEEAYTVLLEIAEELEEKMPILKALKIY